MATRRWEFNLVPLLLLFHAAISRVQFSTPPLRSELNPEVFNRRFANRRVWAVFRFIGLILLAFSSRLYPESFMLHLLLNCLKTQITHTRVQLVCEHKYFFSISSQTWNTPAESRQGEEMDRNVLCPAVLRRWAAMEIRLPGKDHSGSPHRATTCLQSRIKGNHQASKKAKVFPWRSQ